MTAGQDGCTNWMRIYREDFWQVTQCDFIALINNEMFAAHQAPCLEYEFKHLNASVYHLDGSDALRHLDALLEMKELDGIQWVYGAGKPTARHWIEVIKRIQAANKLVQIEVFPEDIQALGEAIKPEGVHFVSWGTYSEDEAKNYVKAVEKAFKKKKVF